MSELPGWMTSKAKGRQQNARSRQQESRRAEEVGGRTSAGSGSSYRSPGDVKSDSHLEELKYTDKKSFSMTVDVLKDIQRKARLTGREPRLVVDFEQHGIRAIVEIVNL